MPSAAYMNTLLFGVYPYVCLAVLLIGSLIRFEREPYTWKSDSSQMLRAGQLRLGSNLFHYGVIVVILGHFVGFLAPDWAVDWALTPVAHQLLAMVVGGIAGVIAIIGLTILIARRKQRCRSDDFRNIGQGRPHIPRGIGKQCAERSEQTQNRLP